MNRMSQAIRQQDSTFTLRELQAQFAKAKLPFPELEPEDIRIPKRKQGFEITNDIYISHYIPSFQREFLQKHEIKALICLSGHHNSSKAEDLGVRAIFSVNMPDGEGTTPEMIRAYTQKLNDFVTKYGRTLVFCQAGQSRSPSLVAAYLARFRNMELESALELVRSARAPERNVKYWTPTVTAIRKILEEV